MTTFIRADSGAVTVDWVVLTAALVGLGLATMAVVSSGVENVSGDIDSELKRDDIIRTSFASAPAFSTYTPFHPAYSANNMDRLTNGDSQTMVNDYYNKHTSRFANAIQNMDTEEAQYQLDALMVGATWLDANPDYTAPDGVLTSDDYLAQYEAAFGAI